MLFCVSLFSLIVNRPFFPVSFQQQLYFLKTKIDSDTPPNRQINRLHAWKINHTFDMIHQACGCCMRVGLYRFATVSTVTRGKHRSCGQAVLIRLKSHITLKDPTVGELAKSSTHATNKTYCNL